MPCTDPRDVTSLDEAFDLTTTEIQQWEDESIPLPAVRRVVRDGTPRSKDVTSGERRQVGVNFEGKRRGGGWLRAKVTWNRDYLVATVHTL
jgi:hypothetical protein